MIADSFRTRARAATGVLAMMIALSCATRTASAQPGAEPARAERPTITVNGNAEISVAPDKAVVRLGMVAQNPVAAEAQKAVNRVMRDLVTALTRSGVHEGAIRTEDLSLFPVYDNAPPAVRADRPSEPRIVGYRASNVVSAEVTDLTKIGDVIDAGINAGANQLQGISFGLRDDSAARSQALRAAVADARSQAETIADALGMRLDGVSQVSAGGGGSVPGPVFRVARAESAVVQPGETTVTGNVTVTYFLGDRR
jgi:uncharacterized protein YggE